MLHLHSKISCDVLAGQSPHRTVSRSSCELSVPGSSEQEMLGVHDDVSKSACFWECSLVLHGELYPRLCLSDPRVIPCKLATPEVSYADIGWLLTASGSVRWHIDVENVENVTCLRIAHVHMHMS